MQEGMWKLAEEIGNKEGRLDVCVAAAGIIGGNWHSLEIKDDVFSKVSFHTFCARRPRLLIYRAQVTDVNLKGVLFAAQAAGKQMMRFGNGGSIIMIARADSVRESELRW